MQGTSAADLSLARAARRMRRSCVDEDDARSMFVNSADDFTARYTIRFRLEGA